MRYPAMVRHLAVRARFGSPGRVAPLSEWGTARGTAVDRYYIEHHLTRYAPLIRGCALEVKSDTYATRFGATSVDIVDIDPANPRANVVGDLCRPDTLQPGSYDVAVVTQTLNLVERPLDAVRHLLEALRPGGSLLITVPALSRIVDAPSDRWRWTPLGLRELLTAAAPSESEVVDVVGLGNGLAARAFLFGLAVEEISEDALMQSDPNYPLVVGAVVRRAP